MPLLTVTVSQRRAVAQVLEGVGLSIGNFDWISHHSRYQRGQLPVDRIVLKGTPYFFQFDRDNQERLWAYHCPGSDVAVQSQHTGTWESQFRTFCEWVSLLLEEVREPDPWERVKVFLPDDALFEGTEGNNSPFSYTEVERIAGALIE